MKEKWVADFSKPERSCFDIKPEISYDAKLEKGSLFIGLKEKHRMAWLETANRVYVDQVVEARFRFARSGSYCAAGIMFRVEKNGSYYLALVSSKNYFRLDAVNDGVPRTLVGWTEAPGAGEDGAAPEKIVLKIIAMGGRFVFVVNGKWVAEADDASVPGGHLGFALVSYSSKLSDELTAAQLPAAADGFVCGAWLEHLSVDSRPNAVESELRKWDEGTEISAESRLCLAETFSALNNFEAAYEQVLKAWKQRENAARSVTATYTDLRTGSELLLAARLASQLDRYETAEEYINACLSAETCDMMDDANKSKLLAERVKVLSALNKFDELVRFLPDCIGKLEEETNLQGMPPIHSLYAVLGHAWWNLKNREAAAAAWDKAFALNGQNALYAERASAAYEKLGRKEEALRCLIAGGNCLLEQANLEKLKALVPKLLALGDNSREVVALAARWTGTPPALTEDAELGGGNEEPALAERASPPDTDEAAKKPAKVRKPKTEPAKDGFIAEPVLAEQTGLPSAEKKPARGRKPKAELAKESKTKTEKKPAAKAATKTKKAKDAEPAPKPATKAKAKATEAAKAPKAKAAKEPAPAKTKTKATGSKPVAAAKAKKEPAKTRTKATDAKPEVQAEKKQPRSRKKEPDK